MWHGILVVFIDGDTKAQFGFFRPLAEGAKATQRFYRQSDIQYH